MGLTLKIWESIGCHNPNLGLMTKVRACKVVGQERKLMSERKCEGMNPHTSKGVSTLGVGVPVDSQMFKSDCSSQNPMN
jgi:hypothetical protein